ncbi:MAG: hypothetical protein Q8O40_11850 [Chloroflexota bacterium]|nr:hypothetical protein [Chloroflexota bacterium]
MDRDTLVAEVSLWLDPTVIAEAIVDGLEQVEAPMTVEQAKAVWLNVLETELPQAVKASAKALAGWR